MSFSCIEGGVHTDQSTGQLTQQQLSGSTLALFELVTISKFGSVSTLLAEDVPHSVF